MTPDPAVADLLSEIRTIYKTDPEKATDTIGDLVQARLSERPAEQARKILSDAIDCLRSAHNNAVASVDSQVATRVFGLILGRKVTQDDLSSTELLERLAHSLNTIFDALNQLISVINVTLSAGSYSGDQTIRQFIGFHLEGGNQTKPLEDYLGQINHAFLTTQKAFKSAAQNVMTQVIQAIDPKKIAAERAGGGLKIGPLRKAEDYDTLKEKIERIQRWFESGRFMEEFLKEFEKNCQSFAMS
jgi:hypothetical protein